MSTNRFVLCAAAAVLALSASVTASAPAVAELAVGSKVTGTARDRRNTTGRCRTLGPTV
jgi:hypothetical protein